MNSSNQTRHQKQQQTTTTTIRPMNNNKNNNRKDLITRHSRRQQQLIKLQQNDHENEKSKNKMSFTIVSLLALLISLSAFSARVGDAKPLNQNQVRFRRLPPKEFSAALGSSITIECEAGASPPPTIHWLRDGKRILQNDFDFETNQLDDGSQPTALQIDDVHRIALSATRSRLFIDCANFEDEATYTCVAENAFSRVSANTKLNLIRPIISSPLPSSGSTDNDLLEEAVALEAAAAAAAAASASGSATAEKTNGGSGAGGLTAVPQCLAQQAQRRARQAEVTEASATTQLPQQTTSPVRIHMWTHNIIEIMKNNIILYCRSNVKRPANVQQQQQQQQQVDQSNLSSVLLGEQKDSTVSSNQDQTIEQSLDGGSNNNANLQRRPQVSWSLPDDKPVTAELKDKYEILDTGDLLIKDLKWADMGSYVCTVTDDSGSDSISTFVYPASSKVSNSKRSVSSMLLNQRNFR